MNILAKYGDDLVEFKEDSAFLTVESKEEDSEGVEDVKESSEIATEAVPSMNPPEENPKMRYPFD